MSLHSLPRHITSFQRGTQANVLQVYFFRKIRISAFHRRFIWFPISYNVRIKFYLCALNFMI